MTVDYEWDVETIADGDSDDYENEEVIDHHHVVSYREAVFVSMVQCEPNTKRRIVLVRDDDDRRAWAEIHSGVLPEYFTDAYGKPYVKVPKRFHIEVDHFNTSMS